MAVERPIEGAAVDHVAAATAPVLSERRAARAMSATTANARPVAAGRPKARTVATARLTVTGASTRPAAGVVVTSPAFHRPAVKSSSKRVVLPLVGFAATFAFMSASLVNPLSGAQAATATPEAAQSASTAGYAAQGQSFTVSATAAPTVSRDAYTVDYTAPVVVKPKPAATTTAKSASTSSGSSSSQAASAPRPVVPSGSAQQIGAQLVAARGWDGSQFSCLVSLWNRESGWNVYASNGSSGAYGIPQALPGSKMSSVGSDWQTSAATQITWGLNYIQGRYSTPCGAWAHSQATGWY